ncbi:MAG: general secretion pathway protein GspK [Nitrospirae bacterium]|nr:general secretion pathway protein GspK [Nitrospirota bacterium]
MALQQTDGKILLIKTKKNEGIALIIVLWVMVMLTAIVGEFAYSMRTELNIARNFKEEEEAYQLALAGIEQAKMEILAVKESAYPSPYFNKNGILVFEQGQEEKDPEREGVFKNGKFSYTIIDEDGKLNINTASQEQIKHVIENSGMEIKDIDTVIDSIMDWKDTDNLHRLNGAEEEYYQSLEKPYSCKDMPFEITEELLLVKGMTGEIFFGSEGNEEKPKYDGMIHYLSAKNSTTININTAPQAVLEAYFGVAVAANIISQRKTLPILAPLGSGVIKSFFFTIISTGSNRDGTIKRTVKTIVHKNGDKLKTIYWNDNWIENTSQGKEQNV